jgi:hypothetical protein
LDLQIADLSNILAKIVGFACNLVRILDCDFIVELLAAPNLDKTIVGSTDFASNLGGFVYPYSHPPSPKMAIIFKLDNEITTVCLHTVHSFLNRNKLSVHFIK